MIFLAASGASVGTVQAFDATLFYAPPTELPHIPLAAPRSAKRSEPPRGRICFNHEEARDRITALRLAEPTKALRTGRLQGEALGAKLCRWRADEFVYEIAVLRSDGHIIHVYMNAQNGENVAP